MTRLHCILVAAATFVCIDATAPVSAQGIVKAVVPNARTAVSDCVRDLKSVQCGRYQEQILRTQLQRLDRATSATAVREVGRRQLDALIASVG